MSGEQNQESHNITREEALRTLQAYLDSVDDETLIAIVQELHAERPLPNQTTAAPFSRREFLKGVFLMGLLGSLSTAGAAYAGFRSGTLAGRSAAEIRLSLEIARLRGLLALYESLEAVGIDHILEQGLNSVGGLLHVADIGLSTVGQGLNAVAVGLDRLETLLDGFSDEVNTARERLKNVLDMFQQLLDMVDTLLEPAERVGNRVLALGNKIMGWLPFGLADRIRPVFGDIAQVVEDTPTAIEDTINQVLEPINELWLRKEGSVGLYPWVIRPLRERVLQPWQEQVDTWQALVQHWEKDLVEPTRTALEERQRIRAQIQNYHI